jgi:hypothetical protein
MLLLRTVYRFLAMQSLKPSLSMNGKPLSKRKRQWNRQ